MSDEDWMFPPQGLGTRHSWSTLCCTSPYNKVGGRGRRHRLEMNKTVSAGGWYDCLHRKVIAIFKKKLLEWV